MIKTKSILYLIMTISIIGCAETVNESSKDVENAFAKIDKKNESLFTKDARKRKYQESIAAAEENKKSNANEAIYNGYGSSKKREKKNKTEIKNKKKSPKKKYKTSAPITYSAYSTN